MNAIQWPTGTKPEEVTCPTGRDGFHNAIICVRDDERLAIEAHMHFNDSFRKLPIQGLDGDDNFYTYGGLGGVPVVIARTRGAGTLNAADVAKNMKVSFKRIKLALLVGFAGGAPKRKVKHADEEIEVDIVLGDVLISTHVVQYDSGSHNRGGFVTSKDSQDILGRHDSRTAKMLDFFASPGTEDNRRFIGRTNEFVAAVKGHATWKSPGPTEDKLYPSAFLHKHREGEDKDMEGKYKCTGECQDQNQEQNCYNAKKKLDCKDGKCEKWLEASGQKLISRKCLDGQTAPQDVQIHFGKIAASEGVMKDGLQRDALVKRDCYIGFEMEGAGVWDTFPTVVIKGVCDYADSHKNKKWQPYAAFTGASCARALLGRLGTQEGQ